MTVPPGADAADELYPNVAAVAATYGDPTGKYAAFLANADNQYPAQAYFLWDQPLSDSNLAAATPSVSVSTAGAAQPTSQTSKTANGAVSSSANFVTPAIVIAAAFLFL